MFIKYTQLAASGMHISDPIYEELGFKRTDPACTRMLAAHRGDELVGVGRLINLGVEAGVRSFELGGMWVKDSARRQGIAGQIVEHLIAWVPDGAALWCTPFADLMELYGAHGFVEVERESAPAALAKRLEFCTAAHKEPVIVTRHTSKSP